MKKLLTIMLLLSTISVMAEWKWEQVSTSGSTSIVLSSDFHVAFNPAQNHFFLSIQNGQNGVDTWMLKGRTWTLLNSDTIWYNMTSYSMFYDSTLNTMVDFRILPEYPTQKTHVLLWDYENSRWILHEEFSSVGYNVAYDSIRQVYVLPGMGWNAHTWEYDLVELAIIPKAVAPGGWAFVYDPIIEKCVLFEHDQIWTWDGIAWADIQSPIPDGWNVRDGVFSTYHGAIVLVTPQNIFLFSNGIWSYLIYDYPGRDWFSGVCLVYNSKEDAVYAFLPFKHISVFRLVNHKHDRPFEKYK